MIDPYPAVYFRGAGVVEDHVCPGRRVVTAALAVEFSVLLAGEIRGRHRHSLECRTGNVVSAQRTADEWFIALVCIESHPGCFVVDFAEAVRGFTVQREHFAVLRV